MVIEPFGQAKAALTTVIVGGTQQPVGVRITTFEEAMDVDTVFKRKRLTIVGLTHSVLPQI